MDGIEGINPGLTDLDLWAALVGIGMPPVVAVVVSARWKPWLRAVAAAFMCVAAGVITTWLAGDLAGLTPVRSVLVCMAATFGAYRKWWHPSGIARWIEQATTPRRRGRRRSPRRAPTRPVDPAVTTLLVKALDERRPR